MSIVELMRRMRELGAPPEAIELAVEAIEAEQKKDAERRAKRAAQKAKERAAKSEKDSDSRATVARHGGDSRNDTPSEVPPKDNNSNPPPTSPSSDADASAPAVAVAGDDREWLFDDGLKQLIAWGKPEKAGRSLIGKWLKNTNDNTELVRKAIQAAAERRVVVPVEWIEQGLKARMERKDEQRNRNGRANSPARSEGTAARVAALMGYQPEHDGDEPAEERRVSDRASWPEGRNPSRFLDAEPDTAGVYRA